MSNPKLSVRLSSEVVERIRKVAAARGMKADSLVQACVDFYLPVIESGFHGSTFAQPMIEQWRDDLREATQHARALPPPKHRVVISVNFRARREGGKAPEASRAGVGTEERRG